MVLKLYGVSDGPPSLSVRQALTHLQVPFELISVDFGAGDHMTPAYAQVLTSLKILINGHYQRGNGQDQNISIGQTTVSKYLQQFVAAVNTKLKPKWIIFPGTEEDRRNVARGFQRKFGVPNVLGAVDCTHVTLFPPPGLDKVQYINHNRDISINVQLMNPQKEIPVLDDDGFFLSESNAILQYVCDKFKPESPLYPKEPKARALVNHRLCFNLSTYYANISAYTMAPIFFDYERTPLGLKKVHIALDVFETYLERLGSSHAAADYLTIADFQLINSTMTLEAIDFDFSKYKRIHKWYNTFKKQYPELWKISEGAMKEIQHFAANPPDLSHMNHPIHPIRIIKK